VILLCPSILAVALGIAATKAGGRHVAIVHDIQSGLAQGLRMAGAGLLGRAMRWCERAVLNRVDVVVVLSAEMRSQLIANGVRSPIAVVPIWVDTEAIRPLPRPDGQPVRVLYSGNLGRKQGLGQIVALAEELQRRGSPIEIILRGDGSQARDLAAEVAARRLGNVRFADLLPRERLSEALAEGDIHLVPQEPEAAEFAVPSKVFGIMAAARPFVATAYPASPLARLRDASGAFVCVAPGDTSALTEAVLSLAADADARIELGGRGRMFVEQYLAKPRVLGSFARLLRTVGAP